METRLGNYVIKKLLGKGGFGTVFLAEHALFGTPCAIKVLNGENLGALDDEMRAMAIAKFREEAKILNTLAHAHIIKVFDGGQDPDGVEYFVMDYFDGPPLRDHIEGRRGQPFEIAEAKRLVVQIASAIGAAHDKGVIHRDIKPENVLVAKQDAGFFAKLLDFGIARLTGEGRSMAAAGHKSTQNPSGTPAYMPPEQWSQPAPFFGSVVGTYTDVYALGVMLYELVTGRLPYTGRTQFELAHQHTDLNVRPTPPRTYNSKIPLTLESLILKMLEKNASDRVQTMDDVVSALGGALDGAAAKPSLEQQLALLKGAPVSPDKERALRELVAAFPKRIEAHVALASFHNGGQRSDLAAEALRAATAALPESGKVRYLLGVALKQSGKLAEARAAFGEALRLGVEEKDRIQVETLLNDMKG